LTPNRQGERGVMRMTEEQKQKVRQKIQETQSELQLKNNQLFQQQLCEDFEQVFSSPTWPELEARLFLLRNLQPILLSEGLRVFLT